MNISIILPCDNSALIRANRTRHCARLFAEVSIESPTLDSLTDNLIARWWHRRALRRAHANIDPELWPAAIRALPLLEGLDESALLRLLDLSALFLQDKALELAQGAELSASAGLELALQACLPILNLGLSWYRGWHALILYPDVFVPAREVVGKTASCGSTISQEAEKHGSMDR